MINGYHGKRMIGRLLGILLAVVFIMGASSCAEDTGRNFFAQFDEINWCFCSGVGGWSTDMQIKPDGTFSGQFHDNEMGDCTDAYPDGTVYYCTFNGRFSLAEQVNENTWKLRVDELKQDEKAGVETVGDGFRYISADPYGISEGDEVLLYKPGTPLDGFTDEMKVWTYAFDAMDTAASQLRCWFLYSAKNESGFVGIAPVNDTSAVNPWETVTAEQLQKSIGVPFSLPEGAESVIYRWYDADKTAEVQFFLNGGDYCFRMQPVALDQGQMTDISGMYFNWENEMSVTIGWCSGILSQIRTETGDQVQRCMWYDSTTGVMYSLSVIAPDLDGLDLAAVSEQIILPPVG